MAFFMPRTVFHSTPFNPLLSLLSELDQVEAQPRRSAPVRRQSPCQAQRQSYQAQRQAPCQPQRHTQPAYRLSVRPWEPRFASHETDDSFVIYGEVPGLNKDHVTIEFPEPRKLVVSGRASTEPAAAAPTVAAAAETESTTESKTVSEASVSEGSAATNDDATAEDTRSRSSFQATVEDDEDSEDFEVLSQHSGRSQSEKAPEAQQQQQQQQQQPKSEPQVQADESHAAAFTSGYTIREFSRYFNFPTYVDHDAVTASLRDGLLTVTVPKARAPEPRRIIIN